MQQKIFPKWAKTVGNLSQTDSKVRVQCRNCGIQQNVDLEAMIGKYGAQFSLIDFEGSCSVVGCLGPTFYMANWSFGRQWILLVSDENEESAKSGAKPMIYYDIARMKNDNVSSKRRIVRR